MRDLSAADDPHAKAYSRRLRDWVSAKFAMPDSVSEWMWQLTNMPLSFSLSAIAISCLTRLFRSS
jgi:hypothetical protein